MLSIIIPCLNEQEHLTLLLNQLTQQKSVSLEILVVDGGSTDETSACATTKGAKVILSPQGRGRQQNKGAAEANGELLLFLHADSRLEHEFQLSESLEAIKRAPKRTAGHFQLKFEAKDPQIQRRLSVFEYKSLLNRADTFSGDQGLLIYSEDFKAMGGFSETYHFLEDKKFAERYSNYGQFTTLSSRLYTSARRFEEEGLEERLTLNTLIMAMFHLKSDYFFSRATQAYRASKHSTRLNLHPLFKLSHEAIFHQGLLQGIVNFSSLGRYAAKNLWQTGLSFHIIRGRPDLWLKYFDKFLKPITDNTVGHLIGAFIVTTWYYSRFIPLAIRSRMKMRVK